MTFNIVLVSLVMVGVAGLLRVERWSRIVDRKSPKRLAGDGSVGTLRWLSTSDSGRLDAMSRLEYWSLASVPSLELPIEVAVRFVGRWKRVVPHQVVTPEGEFASAVRAECERIGAEWLIAHSLRTYEFAFLRGRQTGYSFDAELLWGASLLHDVGLVAPAASSHRGGACFTARSAEIAERIARKHGWGQDRIDQLCEAITLHVNPKVSKSLGIEAWLLQFATSLDVTGVGFWKLYSDAMDETVARYPLAGQRDGILQLWNDETARSPACRAAALNRLGFGLLVKTSPMYTVYG